MYLKMIHNVNVGPMEDAKINFPFNDDSTPKPVIIVGENGTGKSILLSSIVDSFYEIAGKAFYDVQYPTEFNLKQYYRIISGVEIHTGKKYMYSCIQYQYKNQEMQNVPIYYFFKSGDMDIKKLSDKDLVSKIKVGFKKRENYKEVYDLTDEDAEKIFNRNIICYFPPNRYEQPNWMGNKYYHLENFEHPSAQPKIWGQLDKPILIVDVMSKTLQWLLDIIADSRCDVKYIQNNNWEIQHCETLSLHMMNIARRNIEQIMGKILGKEIYFGLNYRNKGGARFNINAIDGSKLVPTLNALSTGQSALFNMFATIIRYADSNDINKSINLQDITGIVVIEEIELHLHSNLQREILPRLLKMFPKVQFIISSHSPLFLLGMDEVYGRDGYEIYQMPLATKITSEKFSEFGKAYKYFSETETHQQEIREVIQQHQGKTLIITEGASDWKHMKAAFEKLKTQDKYKHYADMDFEFLKYEPEESKKNFQHTEKYIFLKMGKDSLKQMCQENAKLKQSRKIIFIADRDDKKINEELGETNSPYYKNWQNNVFSFVLPVPEHRKSTPKICIEHYYTDEEIKTPVEINGIPRRLYVGNEFDRDGFSLVGKFFCRDRNHCGENKINIIDGRDNSVVYKIGEAQTNLALPKMKFAERILNKYPEFENFNFYNFHLIFDLIEQILKEPMIN